MKSFSDAFESALKSDFELKLNGYELFELYHLILSLPPKDIHLVVVSRRIFDLFFERVVDLRSLPFDECDECDVHSTSYPDDVPFPFDDKKYGM